MFLATQLWARWGCFIHVPPGDYTRKEQLCQLLEEDPDFEAPWELIWGWVGFGWFELGFGQVCPGLCRGYVVWIGSQEVPHVAKLSESHPWWAGCLRRRSHQLGGSFFYSCRVAKFVSRAFGTQVCRENHLGYWKLSRCPSMKLGQKEKFIPFWQLFPACIFKKLGKLRVWGLLFLLF